MRHYSICTDVILIKNPSIHGWKEQGLFSVSSNPTYDGVSMDGLCAPHAESEWIEGTTLLSSNRAGRETPPPTPARPTMATAGRLTPYESRLKTWRSQETARTTHFSPTANWLSRRNTALTSTMQSSAVGHVLWLASYGTDSTEELV